MTSAQKAKELLIRAEENVRGGSQSYGESYARIAQAWATLALAEATEAVAIVQTLNKEE